MDTLFAAVETSALGTMARSSVWLYPLSNLAHVLGAAMLVGAIAVFDVLLLRHRFRIASEVAGTALTIAGLGVAIQIASGVVLFSAEATALIRNPVFLVKMLLIAVALINLALYHASRMRGAEHGIPASAPRHALTSLAVWIAVLICGRSIAYV